MSKDKELYERYVAAYDAAQRLHAREVEDERLEAEAAQRYAAQGRALDKIKNLARLAFLLVPDATEEAFEQLWRQAFDAGGHERKGAGT